MYITFQKLSIHWKYVEFQHNMNQIIPGSHQQTVDVTLPPFFSASSIPMIITNNSKLQLNAPHNLSKRTMMESFQSQFAVVLLNDDSHCSQVVNEQLVLHTI